MRVQHMRCSTCRGSSARRLLLGQGLLSKRAHGLVTCFSLNESGYRALLSSTRGNEAAVEGELGSASSVILELLQRIIQERQRLPVRPHSLPRRDHHRSRVPPWPPHQRFTLAVRVPTGRRRSRHECSGLGICESLCSRRMRRSNVS